MRAATSTTLLDDVWQALEELEGPGRRDSGAGPGWITAVSTRGDQLRILLRLPAELCREGASTLVDVADALRALPPLTEVDLEVRPHRASADRTAATGACWHELPAAADLLDQRRLGWVVEGAQPRGSGTSSDNADDTTVRVLVRARIADQESVPDTPQDAA